MTAEQLRELVRAEGLLDPAGAGEGAGPLVAMFSGGRDSTCLLDIAVALRGAGRVVALHVNYGLRADASGDQAHCEELCARLGVTLEVVTVHRPLRDGADAPGNVQAWAREERYRAADGLARGGAPIATGHTADDQLETILYRLSASPGRRALQGMSAREGALVRPLLGVTRAQTTAYCAERGLGWREDASNEDARYARARVRHDLVPALLTVHPGAAGNVLRTAALLREETELLDGLVASELAEDDSIALARLAELPAALARMVVIELAERASGGFVPQAGDRVREIIELGERGGRAELHVGGLAAAVLEGGHLRMVKLPARAPRVPPHAD